MNSTIDQDSTIYKLYHSGKEAVNLGTYNICKTLFTKQLVLASLYLNGVS